MSSYVYVFVRKDLSKAQQLIQSCHAVMEMSKKIESEDISNIVLFEVQDEPELVNISEKLTEQKITHDLFFEPDNSVGYSAIACTPVNTKNCRKIFKDFNMYR